MNSKRSWNARDSHLSGGLLSETIQCTGTIIFYIVLCRPPCINAGICESYLNKRLTFIFKNIIKISKCWSAKVYPFPYQQNGYIEIFYTLRCS